MRARRTVQQVGAYENLELEPFCAGLPFSLTGAQRRAMEEIAGDLRRGVPMNRLLQGDVGSGKPWWRRLPPTGRRETGCRRP